MGGGKRDSVAIGVEGVEEGAAVAETKV